MPAHATQDLLYNVTGQTLALDAPSRPASITSVAVYSSSTGDDGTAETATTGSAAVETNPNTTVDANSGVSSANPRLLNVAATTGFVVGREYRATNADGATEWFEVASIDSGNSVTTRSPLLLDYVSGDAVVSTRATIAVANAWIQDATRISDSTDPNPGYRVRWQWVDAAGVTHVDVTGCDVVRYRGGDHGVNAADMVRFFDAWLRLLPKDARSDQGQAIIDAAYERFEDDLLALEIPDQQVRNQDVKARMVRYAARRELLLQVFLGGGDAGAFERYTVADQDYQAQLDKLFRISSRVDIGTGASGAATRVPPQGIWSR